MIGIAALLPLASPRFALRAEALPSVERLRIRLSVTNVTSKPQTLWMATPDCTNARWTVSPPDIRIVDYAEEHDKTCQLACGHHRTLRPGETFVRTVEPRMPHRRAGFGLSPGPLTLTVTLAQPNPDTLDDRSLPEIARYHQLLTTSNPVRVDVKPAWLRG